MWNPDSYHGLPLSDTSDEAREIFQKMKEEEKIRRKKMEIEKNWEKRFDALEAKINEVSDKMSELITTFNTEFRCLRQKCFKLFEEQRKICQHPEADREIFGGEGRFLCKKCGRIIPFRPTGIFC